jgi:phosphoglycerate dehydrogenase-like enzyme
MHPRSPRPAGFYNPKEKGGRVPRIMIASPLDAELVRAIAVASPDSEIDFDPGVLPPIRYPSDHRGPPEWRRSDEAEQRWRELLASADIMYGVPADTGAGLAAALPLAPHVRWVQGTSAGAGELVRAAALSRELLERVTFTSAAGVHGGMLAEFVFGGIIALRKDFRRLERVRAQRTWPHFPSGELAGSSIAVVGLGSIGSAVARIARAFEMRVIAVTRSGTGGPDAEVAFPMSRLGDAFAAADAVVITLPGTEQTEGIVSEAVLSRLRRDAIFCNVGRGSIVDQVALTRALECGTIAGAVLDVFDTEPLPPDDPLWSLENVIFSPHTMALSVHENERIVALFCDNLERYARGRPLRNRIDTVEFY